MAEKSRTFRPPSSIDHPAYALWSGDHYNKDRPKKEHINLDVSHRSLKNGRLCEDNIWRQVVTIEDAVNSDYTLVTIEKLRKKFPPAKFNNLAMCQFIDSTDSVFKLRDLQRCGLDTLEKWPDYNPELARPLGNQEVWLGYDPSRHKDDASISLIAPPKVPGGKFRRIMKVTMNDWSYEAQVAKIKSLTKIFNITYMGIDASGMGDVVYELVCKFFPMATAIKYSVEVKNRMVLKAKNIIEKGLLEYDKEDIELPMAFMTIHRSNTASGNQITYSATRTATTGHADEAWAVMHALDNRKRSTNTTLY